MITISTSWTQTLNPKTSRFIPKSPDKILDAPDLVDDYYLNLLDWSKANILAVALRQVTPKHKL